MAPLKGEEESWFGNGDSEQKRNNLDSVSARVSNKAQEVFKRQPTDAAGEADSDAEDGNSGCCFFRGRSTRRKMHSDGSGTPFGRLGTDDPKSMKAKAKNLSRSRTMGAMVFCCCKPRGQTNYAVEVRAADTSKQDKTWEIDVNEEYYKPPYWKQLIRKVKGQALARQGAHQYSSCDWLNYDLESYRMNFDDGCWRENCVSSLYADENDDPATRARVMHSALHNKLSVSCTQQGSPRSPMSPGLSPLPVKMMSKEELANSKHGFVPIWQRRQGAPPIKLDLRQRAGPQG